MKHHVAYHNPETMGYPFEHSDPAAKLAFYTSRKGVSSIVGDVVWMVTSEAAGRKKDYRLCGWYIVDSVLPSDNPSFDFLVEGDGVAYSSMPCLNGESWFPSFLKSQGNFGFGINRIQDRFLQDIQALATSKNLRLP